LLVAELTRQIKEGNIPETNSQWAENLLRWLDEAFPDEPRPTVKTVLNNLRPQMNGARKSAASVVTDRTA